MVYTHAIHSGYTIHDIHSRYTFMIYPHAIRSCYTLKYILRLYCPWYTLMLYNHGIHSCYTLKYILRLYYPWYTLTVYIHDIHSSRYTPMINQRFISDYNPKAFETLKYKTPLLPSQIHFMCIYALLVAFNIILTFCF